MNHKCGSGKRDSLFINNTLVREITVHLLCRLASTTHQGFLFVEGGRL